ncbi:carboxy-terminal crystallin fold protein (macronuclear) [Tetrahymena thermophila SB210]|uniref:Carboxy-terminal crystallin fold protein n=2 Tax=Tetrahymena thermophila TaxID=5911 RepID=Q24I20_TETTS|nr:carboxy-terminal crystallin fold protein [Tetrahymena thermophila SB210]ABC75100.1 C-terminal crystallin fold containing protein 13p [Tetrahymena thermophila]EAS07418.1 carboxy-terminal crystallin fold protein [Tetrahymena thermophila SB210]|eukprot:XP_001027660.1 carboxy-terminal crystallin fold protein [Tetrahymena thermophila SB210]
MKTTLVVFIILGLAFSKIGAKQSQTQSVTINNNNPMQSVTITKGGQPQGDTTTWDGVYKSLKVTDIGQKPVDPVVTPAQWDGVYKSLKVTNDVTKPEEPPVLPPKVCPTLYKQCYFKGDPIQLCDKIPKFDIKTIHSVWIPDGSRVTLYEKSDYSGKSITFKETIPCIDSLSFS